MLRGNKLIGITNVIWQYTFHNLHIQKKITIWKRKLSWRVVLDPECF